jgi:beta-glucanase (GH16 family)
MAAKTKNVGALAAAAGATLVAGGLLALMVVEVWPAETMFPGKSRIERPKKRPDPLQKVGAQRGERSTRMAVGDILFQDNFGGAAINETNWHLGLHQWGSNNQGVVPENLALRQVTNNNGDLISVLETTAHGDLYTGDVKGILTTNTSYPMGDPRRYTRQADGKRTGGLLWTNKRFGPARYEVRMKNLPLSGGCSCMWNYYEPGEGDNTEIDIEMPADGYADATNSSSWAGFNTYYPTPIDGTYQNIDIGSQNDGKFHVYRWDWYAGEKVDFFVDGRLVVTSTTNVPSSPAQLWVGNWPAPWSGDFNYDTQHLYIDWVRITSL